MLVSTPDKALLKLLLEVVQNNGRFDAVPFTVWAERVKRMEEAGLAIYDAAGDMHALQSAVKRDAEYLAALGFVELHPEAAQLTVFGRFLAESLEYPDWALLQLEEFRRGEERSPEGD